MSAVVHDVPARFRAIPPKVRRSTFFGSTAKYLGAHNVSIPWPDYTTQTENRGFLLEHFQGVQRVGGSLILSGGTTGAGGSSQLVVIRMGSRGFRGPWALPAYADSEHSYRHPRPNDASIEVITIH